MDEIDYSPEQIERAARIAAHIICELADGKYLPIAKYYKNLPDSYTLGMGSDGRIGIVAHFDNGESRISDDWTVGELIRFVIKNEIQPLPEMS